MILEPAEVLERYDISYATLKNRKNLIRQHGGIDTEGSRGMKTLYKSSILDKLAREMMLGSSARKAIENLDKRRGND